ncbi:MobA/MobL family protein [Barrientosiimonas marina]|uniref:MobA/MobL family protein n=1 Tax=Lentibacillus kimchii TaxID=1542911 RepID=A0ABW2UTB8_9BACI
MANGYYMFNCQIVNKGIQSAVAMAAYRSDQKLYCDEDGLTKSYKLHEVEPESFILKPDHAPEWAGDRETLWNEVEAFEKHDHAQIARNVMMPLPKEMTREQQTETAKEYIQENFIQEGVVADVSIHRDEEHNPHAHVLLTVRPLDENGQFETRKSKRVPVLDDQGNQLYDDKGWRRTRSVKMNNWHTKETLLKWRENWAAKLNEKAKQFHIDKEYSHKSYKDQGKTQKPLWRLSRQEYQFEARRKEALEKEDKAYAPKTFFAQQNEAVKAYNQEHQAVIHLEDYKTDKDFQTFLNDVRKRDHASDDEVEATKLLVDRAKGYVDYDVAKQLYADFHQTNNKWAKKLERDFKQLDAEKDLYQSIVEEYNQNPSSAQLFGYTTENFKEEMTNDLENYKHHYAQKEEEQAKFEELKRATEMSLKHQRRLLHEEFSAVYETDKSFSDEEKYFAVNQLKRHNNYIPENHIEDEYRKYSNVEESRHYIPAWKQAHDMMKSIRIYDNTINKIENTNLTKLDPETIKRKLIQSNSFQNLKESYEQQVKDLEPMIDHEMERYLPYQADMKDLPIQTKTALLEGYYNLPQEKQEAISGHDLMKQVFCENELKAEHSMMQSQEADNDRDRESYRMVSQESQEISDGLTAVLYEFENLEAMDDEYGQKQRQAQKKRHIKKGGKTK